MILYRKTQAGAIQEWSIAPLESGLLIVHGLVNGAKQEKIEDIEINKSGRSLKEQVFHRMESRINDKLKLGYCTTIKEALSRPHTNAIGLAKPMLAKIYEDVQPTNLDNYYVQYKYDGHRCLITKQNGELIAYSRMGVPITTIQHILDEIDIDEGMTLDGELYCHGQSLQTISSWAKRKQPNTSNLRYVCYDIIDDESYHSRLSTLRNIIMPMNHHIVGLAPTHLYEDDKAELTKRLHAARALGYEGLILRHIDYGYEVGKRSKGLLKVKAWHDIDVKVVDINISADGWAVLVCAMPGTDKTFKVSAPGTILDKMIVADNAPAYIGKHVTVEYANLTKDGIPFHPVAIRFLKRL